MIQWQVRVQGEIDRVRMNHADPTAWPPVLEATAQARESDTATAQQHLTSFENIVLALRQQLNFEMVRIWQGPAAEARFWSFDPQNHALERCHSELIELVDALRRETTALQDVSRAMRAGGFAAVPVRLVPPNTSALPGDRSRVILVTARARRRLRDEAGQLGNPDG